MTKTVSLIFPHQLFLESPVVEKRGEVYLIEEYLFFKQYKFHKQKIAFHRASMKAYQTYLENKGMTVHYVESGEVLSDIRKFGQEIKDKGIEKIHLMNPTDDWLEQRIRKAAKGCTIEMSDNLLFLNTEEELAAFFKKDKKSFFQTTFYKQQRKKRNILLDEDKDPVGGKWTYDTENRKKYPKNKKPPLIEYPDKNKYWKEAVDYTKAKFDDHLGNLSEAQLYPVTHEEAQQWLDQFLTQRFYEFGPYEDAIVKEASILNHSVLSPLINTGLLTAEEILYRALDFSEKEAIPINSTEGFVRQIIGWREFMRGMYVAKGAFSRTRNFWNFDRKIPPSFYDGTTGIEPFDQTIKKVLETGYCHHIERLMVLGNFMLLCEIDPDEVYRWFMELFIDAYDWVMVPNVYGMCLFADGGTFATKPYIGGSNYIRKTSDYEKGDWEDIWDGMFWGFIDKHEDFFRTNPRTSMLVHTYDRMSDERKKTILKSANDFINNKLKTTT